MRLSTMSLVAAPHRRLALSLLAAGLTLPSVAQAKPDRLKSVLSEMDAASAKFHSAQADVKKEHFEKIVNDTSGDSGSVYFLRVGIGTQAGVKLENGQVFEYKNGAGRLYNAQTNHLDRFSTSGSNQARAEAFLTLGFGGTGSDLAKAWTITDQGTEQMNDGSKNIDVEKLDLVSKEASVRNNYSHITIWVDPARDISLKQIFFTPSGDTDSATYKNFRLNQSIDLKKFAIQCKGKCS